MVDEKRQKERQRIIEIIEEEREFGEKIKRIISIMSDESSLSFNEGWNKALDKILKKLKGEKE